MASPDKITCAAGGRTIIISQVGRVGWRTQRLCAGDTFYDCPFYEQLQYVGDTRVQALMQRCGFAAKGLFVMDGSKRSAHANAYFTGLGVAKRVVFFDTLLQRLTPGEVEAVLAHELGHFRRRHVAKRLLAVATITLLGLALLGWLRTQPWFFAGLGAPAATPAVALVLFLLVAPVFTQFLRPVGAWLSRRQEFEADAYAAAHADAGALIRALVKLYRDNASTLTPDPLYSAVHHSHPPAPVRVAHLEALASGKTP